MFIVQTVQLDYDDYPVGRPYNKVGPFKTREEAEEWICETYKTAHHYYARDGRGRVQVEDVLAGVTSPEQFAARRALKDSNR